MITAYIRGHLVKFNGIEWAYVDNGEDSASVRPYIKCGKMPTKEGYDSCLGCVPGIRFACCGHGKESPYKDYERFWWKIWRVR